MTYSNNNDLDHLKAVAGRNEGLYRASPQAFTDKMIDNGWEDSDISQMIKIIERNINRNDKTRI